MYVLSTFNDKRAFDVIVKMLSKITIKSASLPGATNIGIWFWGWHRISHNLSRFSPTYILE